MSALAGESTDALGRHWLLSSRSLSLPVSNGVLNELSHVATESPPTPYGRHFLLVNTSECVRFTIYRVIDGRLSVTVIDRWCSPAPFERLPVCYYYDSSVDGARIVLSIIRSMKLSEIAFLSVYTGLGGLFCCLRSLARASNRNILIAVINLINFLYGD